MATEVTRKDIEVQQHTTFVMTVTVYETVGGVRGAKDLTGYLIEGKARDQGDSTFISNPGQVVTFDGLLTDAANGIFTATLTVNQTSDLLPTDGSSQPPLYDILITLGSEKTKVVWGEMEVMETQTYDG